MTIDDVVTRTAMTLGTVILTAVLAWVAAAGRRGQHRQVVRHRHRRGPGRLRPRADPVVQAQAASPALILAYAAFEGVFLGVISQRVSTYVGPGAVVQAVLGTMCVFAGVLIAYKTR